MSHRTVALGGRYFRVADPLWADPLDPSYALTTGGRWNPPSSFGVLYLNATAHVARLNVTRLYAGLPYGPEDLDADAAPLLVAVNVVEGTYLDCVSDDGLRRVGLPETYPDDAHGVRIAHSVCQPIGHRAFDDELAGVTCPSAAPSATRADEELAWFDHGDERPTEDGRQRFHDWY